MKTILSMKIIDIKKEIEIFLSLSFSRKCVDLNKGQKQGARAKDHT